MAKVQLKEKHSDMARSSKSMLDTIGNTPLVELKNISPNPKVQIFAKLEGQNPTGSVKDRIAKYMIQDAEKNNILVAGKTIFEPTSGNTGISLALVGKLKGYKVKVVMPDNVSPERTALLKAYGAEVVFSDGKKGTNGSIVVAQEMAQANPGYFMPYQYGNHSNPQAHYETTGEEIVQQVPDVTAFVAGLGTGGTLMGVGRRLKAHNPAVSVIAVAPEIDDSIQGLRSLEEGFVPPILDMSVLDSRMMVGSADAFRMTKELLDREGIFAGISSGSVVHSACVLAKRTKSGIIVCLLADGGWKYLSTGLWTKEYREMEDEASGKIWW